jgi:hypothetical protein
LKKISKKNFKKKRNIKKISKKISKEKIRLQIGVCLRKFRVSRPAGLGGDRERTNSGKRLGQIII